MKFSQIFWREPNRANTPPLHIASGGKRFSTLTGVCWIDQFRFVVSHRSGLRIALFDTRDLSDYLAITTCGHLTDDIAAKKLDKNLWEIVVSGCWDNISSIYRLTIEPEIKFELITTNSHTERTYCHGVSFTNDGTLCLAFHTGEIPRIVIGNKAWLLPSPWGARNICHDKSADKYYVVAVSANPQLSAYKKTSTTIWMYDIKSDVWKIIMTLPNVHADACQVFEDRIWLPDQNGDQVLGLCLSKKRPVIAIKGRCFDFPHGLGISNFGILAVTNYGDSSITLIDINSKSINV